MCGQNQPIKIPSKAMNIHIKNNNNNKINYLNLGLLFIASFNYDFLCICPDCQLLLLFDKKIKTSCKAFIICQCSFQMIQPYQNGQRLFDLQGCVKRGCNFHLQAVAHNQSCVRY